MEIFDCSWLSLLPATGRDLPGDQEPAQVWKADLDLEPDQIAALEQSLAPEERARAARFRFAGDRRRFAAARGSLRIVLGHSLRREPHQVPIAYTSDNKPILAGEHSLRFNVSHSDSLALIAVTRGREIGADIECLRTDFEPEPLARRFFAPREYAAVCRVPPAERHRVFLSYWTCKEAYLKAVGTGLRSALKEFAVSPEERSITLFSPAGGETQAPYRLQPLDPAPGYVAALAVEIPLCREVPPVSGLPRRNQPG